MIDPQAAAAQISYSFFARFAPEQRLRQSGPATISCMRRSSKHSMIHWTIEALLDAYPYAARVLIRHRMACVGCTMAPFESVAEAAAEYRVDLDAFLNELKKVGNEQPCRPGAVQGDRANQ